MMFESNPAPRNRRNSSRKRRSQSILDVNMRSSAAASQRNRKIMKWLCILILIGTVSAAVFCGVREGWKRYVLENPRYVLSSLEIVTDGTLSREEVTRESGIQVGMNTFSINLSKAQQKLMKLSRVEFVEITKTRSDRIAIKITERKPVAWIAATNTEDPSSDPKSFLVDGRGTLISGKNYLPEYLHLPIIYGVPTENLSAGECIDTYELRAALDLVRITADSARVQVCSIDLSKRYCMIVTDRSRAKITFGMEKIDEQLDRLAIVLDHVESTKQELQTVNLMVQRNIPVTFATGSPEPEATPGELPVPPKGQKPDSSAHGKDKDPADSKAKAHSETAASESASSSRDTGAKKKTPAPSSSTKATGKSKPAPPSKASSAPPVAPQKEQFMDNMPVRKAIPVNSSPNSSRHNG